tara:strand:+ start:339 stop:533 length:195 start_codon:yes stop_codon:yes gene_type:complete
MTYQLERYKQNLRINQKAVYSYNTEVAKINHIKKQVIILGWWSQTTSKHINYVARELGYQVINN